LQKDIAFDQLLKRYKKQVENEEALETREKVMLEQYLKVKSEVHINLQREERLNEKI